MLGLLQLIYLRRCTRDCFVGIKAIFKFYQMSPMNPLVYTEMFRR